MEPQTTIPMRTCKYCNCSVPTAISDTTECATSRSTTPDSPESTGKQSSNTLEFPDTSGSSTPEAKEEQPFISQTTVKLKLKRTDAQLAALKRGRERLAEKRNLLKQKQKEKQLEIIHETDENEETNVNNSSCSIL